MKITRKVKNAVAASALALSLMAAPAFAATVNSNPGSNHAVTQTQTNGPQQSTPTKGVSLKNQQDPNGNCSTGLQVPSPMGGVW